MPAEQEVPAAAAVQLIGVAAAGDSIVARPAAEAVLAPSHVDDAVELTAGGIDKIIAFAHQQLAVDRALIDDEVGAEARIDEFRKSRRPRD